MDNLLDCSGLACPEPVLRTKSALETMGQGVLTVRVDNAAARENVRRFAESQGCVVRVREAGAGIWELEIAKGFTCGLSETAEPSVSAAEAPLAVLVVSDRLGAEPELGELLMRSFLGTLAQSERKPKRMLFLNRGIHLTTEGSQVAEVLQELADAGTEILSCGTCLEFFGKKDRVLVGRVASMYDTVDTLTGGFRTVTVG